MVSVLKLGILSRRQRIKCWFSLYFIRLECGVEDAETEVALNLICVDEATKKTIDIPIRARPVRDLLDEMHHKKHILRNEAEIKSKMRDERKQLNHKSGNHKPYIAISYYFFYLKKDFGWIFSVI